MTLHDSHSPNTGQVFAHWTEPEPAKIAHMLDRLARGTKALSADMALRQDVLMRCQTALAAAHDELADTIINEVGKTRPEADGELPYAASFLDTSRQLLAEYPFVTDAGDGRQIRAVPRGTGLLITPYNDPIAGLTRKIGPCIAAGAAALVKPSDLGVQCALTLARHLSAAGLDDYIAILPLTLPDQISALIAQRSIGTVSFTGSTDVGLKVATQAAAQAKAHVGEWGGTNPFVVFADADLERATADIVTRKIKAAGQACSAHNIVYAETPVMEELCERVASAFDAVRFGPATENVTMGPVRTANAVTRLAQAGTALEKAGARSLCGGVTPVLPNQPYLAAPTAYALDQPGILAEQEMFGPLMGICRFDDRTALWDSLSRNQQPLVLYLYGQDTDAAKTFAAGLHYGSVGINTTGIQSPDAPTGGFASAGIGREGGHWGLAEFLTTINQMEKA